MHSSYFTKLPVTRSPHIHPTPHHAMTAIPAPNPPPLHPTIHTTATNLPPQTALFPAIPSNLVANGFNPVDPPPAPSTHPDSLPNPPATAPKSESSENNAVSGQSASANLENTENIDAPPTTTTTTSAIDELPDDTTDSLSRPSQSVSPEIVSTSASPSPAVDGGGSRRRSTSRRKKKRKKGKKRCTALDYLSDSPRKKRGRKVKDKKHLPPIQKQPFFLVFPDLRLKCPQCDHIAICQGTLVQHLRTHPESRKCPVCSKLVECLCTLSLSIPSHDMFPMF